MVASQICQDFLGMKMYIKLLLLLFSFTNAENPIIEIDGMEIEMQFFFPDEEKTYYMSLTQRWGYYPIIESDPLEEIIMIHISEICNCDESSMQLVDLSCELDK